MKLPDAPNLLAHVGQAFLGKISGVLSNAALSDFLTLSQHLLAAPRIFVCGAGRSGLVARFFAMRLMHLGCTVYVVGETTTPATQAGDLLLAISGSGKTATILDVARLAKQAGANLAVLSLYTGEQLSPLDELATLRIKLDRRINAQLRQQYGLDSTSLERKNITPMGTVFEISALIYLESIIAEMMQQQEVSETSMKTRHANLE